MSISLDQKVKNYDNTLIGKLISYVENPDSIGYMNGRWYSPQYDKRYVKGKFDVHNFGMGIDENENDYIKNHELKFYQDNKGRAYLSEKDEHNARQHSIANAENSYNQRLTFVQNKYKTNIIPSDMKKALTISAIYNLGQGTVAKELFEDESLMRAFLYGTDLEYSDQINKYYKLHNKGDRGEKTNQFIQNYLELSVEQPDILRQRNPRIPVRAWKRGGNIKYYQNGGKTDNVTLEGPPMKEVVVEGYRPIELHTFYPFKGLYPYTGHSEMYIPISNKVADEYGLRDADAIERGKQIVMRVNRRSTEHDYNLLTNNCADATLCYLNKMFGTKAKPWFFTTPGDVRDFALSSLRGKVGKKSKSTNSDTVYIPRTKNNADAMSRKALELFLEEHLPQNRIFHSVLGYQKQGGKFKWYLEQK